MLALFVLIFFGCSWGCAVIAHQKGRNPVAWFILGAMFGFIAVIVLLMLDNRR